MNILAVDTSGPVAGVAVLRNGALAYEGLAVNKMTHSVNMMPMVEEALNRSGLTVEEIDLYAAVVGPGSFTGVRIGVSAVKGMAHGAGKPCIAVDALEALAAGLFGVDGILCPIQDARAGQVYGAAFRAGMPPERLLTDMAEKLPDYLAKVLAIAKPDEKLIFVGDGVGTYRQAIINALGDRAVFPPAHCSCLRPSSVAMLANANQDAAVDYLTLMPLYLRAPQAERARAAKEAAKA